MKAEGRATCSGRSARSSSFAGGCKASKTGPSHGLNQHLSSLPDELTELVVEPDTALAILTRARVPRRDVVKLSPVY